MHSLTEIATLLRKFKLRKTPVYFSVFKLEYSFQSRILDLNGDKIVLQNPVPPSLISKVVHQSSYSLQIGTLCLQADSISSDGENIIFPIQQNKVLPEIRHEERFNFVSKAKASCKLLNPFDKRTMITKKIIGLPTSGISIRNDTDSEFFSPGLIIDRIEIYIAGKHLETREGKIIYKQKIINSEFEVFNQIGIKFSQSLEKV